MSWMGQYMMGLLSGIDAQSRQRENDWRHARQEQERMQFADTLQRQRENEARARAEAERKREVEGEVAEFMRRQSGFQGLTSGEQEEVAALQAGQAALQAAPQESSFVGPVRPGEERPFTPEDVRRQEVNARQQQMVSNRIKFLRDKEAGAFRAPMTFGTVSDYDKADRGWPRSAAVGTSTEDKIRLQKNKADQDIRVAEGKEKVVTPRKEAERKLRLDITKMNNEAAYNRALVMASQHEKTGNTRAAVEIYRQTAANLRALHSSVTQELASLPNVANNPRLVEDYKAKKIQIEAQLEDLARKEQQLLNQASQSKSSGSSVKAPVGEMQKRGGTVKMRFPSGKVYDLSEEEAAAAAQTKGAVRVP